MNPPNDHTNLEDVLLQVKDEKLSINDAASKLKLSFRENRRNKPRFFVTKIGSVGVRGINGNRPIVLYKDQWESLARLFQSGHLDNFIEKNEDLVKVRPSRKSMEEQRLLQEHNAESILNAPPDVN